MSESEINILAEELKQDGEKIEKAGQNYEYKSNDVRETINECGGDVWNALVEINEKTSILAGVTRHLVIYTGRAMKKTIADEFINKDNMIAQGVRES